MINRDGFGKVYKPLQLADYVQQQPEVVKPIPEQPNKPIVKVRVKVKEVEEEDFEDESFASEEEYSSEMESSNKREHSDDSDEYSENIKRRR